MKNTTVTTRQRFIDEAGTMPLDGRFNVYVGRTYIGVVYKVGDQWQWGHQQHERCDSFDTAVALHADLHHRHAQAIARHA